MTDPIFNGTQGGNPQTQAPESHQGIFGGSSDVFNNPDMFQPVAPEATPVQDDFHLDLGQLEASQHASAASEPIVIEPPEAQETWEEYQAKQNPPQPEIIEQVIEPEMKPEVKVNPRNNARNEDRVPRTATPAANVQKPIPRPQVQPVPKPVQAPRPQVQAPIPPKPAAPTAPKVQPAPQPRPQNSGKYQVESTKYPTQAQAPKPTIAPETVSAKQASTVNRVPGTVSPSGSDLQKKFNELLDTTRKVYTLEKKETDQTLELLGAKNDKVTILYQITLPENGITIRKIETDIDTQEEMTNDLGFTIEDNSLQVLLDDVLLFDEMEHLQDDPKKKMQVSEKLNKFIFLLSEHQKKMEKEAKEKEEAEQERRRLQDIFRNF